MPRQEVSFTCSRFSLSFYFFLIPISYSDLVYITNWCCERILEFEPIWYTGIFLYFNQDNYTLSPSHQPIQTNLHRKLKYSLCLIISNETSLHLQQLKRATYNMLWFIERNPCFHIYRNVSDCYRWKHTRYSVYEVNVMLRERFGLGHRSSPARVITKTSCLSDDR